MACVENLVTVEITRAGTSARGRASMTRPNIALIIADDVPRNMLGAYGAEHGLSPHLDQLARDGLIFERAYTTAPLCTPSRFSLLTGRYASNASSIVSHRPWNLVGFNTFLTGTEPTIAHRLQRAGYATCFVGKYHLGFPLPKTQRRGRNAWGGSGRGLSYSDIVDVVRTYGGFAEIPAVWGGNKQTAQSPHNPEWMAAMAAQFVQRATAAADKKPFFLYFAGTVPHSPFSLPASLEVNVTRTPAGAVSFEPTWQARRHAVLRRLVNAALVCKDYRQCHGRGGKPLPEGGVEGATYEGAQFRTTSIGYKRPLSLTDPWLDGQWLYNEPNFEQGRLARLFVAGLAWLDDSIGTVLDALRHNGVEGNTIVAYTADHGVRAAACPPEHTARMPARAHGAHVSPSTRPACQPWCVARGTGVVHGQRARLRGGRARAAPRPLARQDPKGLRQPAPRGAHRSGADLPCARQRARRGDELARAQLVIHVDGRGARRC